MEEMRLSEAQKTTKEYILKCIAKEMTVLEAAMTLAVTERTVYNKMARYREKGDKSLFHGNTGKKRVDEVKERVRNRIIDIFQNTRVDGQNPFRNVTYEYFTVALDEEFGIQASVGWVKKILKGLGYESPIIRKVKKNPAVHLLRERKEHTGELVQADGTPYDWFMDGHSECIQGFIDDADGVPRGLYMTKNECLLGYVEAFRNMAETDGIPEQLYPDRLGVFFVNKKTDDGERHLTQFGLMMERLGVDMFPAYSPQAKGRIERFWQTIQHRLPTLLKLRGIKTIEAANVFLRDEFPKVYRRWFPKEAKSSETKFVKADMHEVNKILKATYPGKTDGGGVFSLMGYRFLCPALPASKILIHLSEREGLWVTTRTDTSRHHSVRLVETDTTGRMPEVMKDLIERTFLRNAKARHREVYLDIDDVILSEVCPRKKPA